MRHAWLIAAKDLRLLGRDRMALFWVVVFPLLFASFFGAVLTSSLERDRRATVVALVDEEQSERSRALTRELRADPLLVVHELDGEAARDQVRRGDLAALVRLPPLPQGVGAARGPSWELGVDPAKQVDAALVRGAVLAAWQRVATALAPPQAGDAATMTLEQRAVLPAGRAPRTAFDLVFPAAIAWGLMGCAASFAVARVTERTRGTEQRLVAAPLSRRAVLVGKALACFVACLFDAALLLAIGRGLFGVVPESWPLLLLVVPLAAWAFVGITAALSTLGRTEQSVAGAGWSTLIVLAMLGGGMVPQSAMPPWLASWSALSPVRWAIYALEGAVWRGLSLAALGPALAVLALVGLVGVGVGTLVDALRARQE